jgi:hypothetical protein
MIDKQQTESGVSKKRLDELKAVLVIMLEVIQSAGPTGIPSGHFYAQLMGHMTFKTYQDLIDVLVASGKVRLSGHVLTAEPVEVTV